MTVRISRPSLSVTVVQQLARTKPVTPWGRIAAMGFFRTAILGLEQRSITPPETTDTAGPAIPSRPSTGDYSLTSVVGLTGIYRGLSILQTAAGQLALDAIRGGQVMQDNVPLLVTQPDVDTTQAAFVRRSVLSLAAAGNAFWRKFRSPDERVTSVKVLDPLAVTWEYDRQGRRTWFYADAVRGTVELADRDVVHLKLLELPGMELGLGPIQAARTGLSGALDLQGFSDRWFTDSDVPTGVLRSDQPLDKTAADQYADAWHERLSRRRIAVLGKGLEYQPTILSPVDAQWLESRQFSITEQARLLGIPASYLLAEVNGSSMTYSNVTQVDQVFLRYTLMQYLNLIEESLSTLLVRGQTARFRYADFLRPDAKTRAEIQAVYLDKGVIDADEVRAAEGFGPRTSPAPSLPVINQREDSSHGA